MRKCQRCGNIANDESSFCPKCGNQLTNFQSNTNNYIPKNNQTLNQSEINNTPNFNNSINTTTPNIKNISTNELYQNIKLLGNSFLLKILSIIGILILLLSFSTSYFIPMIFIVIGIFSIKNHCDLNNLNIHIKKFKIAFIITIIFASILLATNLFSYIYYNASFEPFLEDFIDNPVEELESIYEIFPDLEGELEDEDAITINVKRYGYKFMDIMEQCNSIVLLNIFTFIFLIISCIIKNNSIELLSYRNLKNSKYTLFNPIYYSILNFIEAIFAFIYAIVLFKFSDKILNLLKSIIASYFRYIKENDVEPDGIDLPGKMVLNNYLSTCRIFVIIACLSLILLFIFKILGGVAILKLKKSNNISQNNLQIT